ncbi:MAG: insulinase family protein [Planctomycetota bacterium]|nr:MAG: insulinase family protein [Planctomycetota bacterium]
MIEQRIQTHRYENGLVLVVETLPETRAVACEFLIPAGSAFDPPGRNGTANLLSDMIVRGAGAYDARQLADRFDFLGVQFGTHAGTAHMWLSFATLSDRLMDVLPLCADVILRPHFPEKDFAAGKESVAQSLRAIEEDPLEKLTVELRRHALPEPWSKPSEGTLEDLPRITLDDVREHYRRHVRPAGTIVGVAGRIEFERIRDALGELLAGWSGPPEERIRARWDGPRVVHLPHASHQTHIAVAFEAVPYADPQHYDAWMVASVLGGGSSSRLFTEVRERRGLCYSVYASLVCGKGFGRIVVYTGTTADRAQETLDVMWAEFRRLGEPPDPAAGRGVSEHELRRSKARVKSAMIMQQELAGARASAIARDWSHLGRVRTADEIRRAVDAVSAESIHHYIRQHPFANPTVVTIGPEPLEVPR